MKSPVYPLVTIAMLVTSSRSNQKTENVLVAYNRRNLMEGFITLVMKEAK